jgi:ribosomal 50S subunit-associated protein YjgA (DUF615 family)
MPSELKPMTPLTPQQLRKLAEEKEMVEARKAHEEIKKAEENERAMREAFMAREVRPDAMERVMAAVKLAAEQGKHEILLIRFSSSLLSDGGRRVNNFLPDWPDSLEGFAKRAYDAFKEHLAPVGYKMRAEILDYPHGNLGDVGLFLVW